jgi:hypothetical protein
MKYMIFLMFLILPIAVSGDTVVRKDGKTFTGTLISQSEQGVVLKEKDGTILRFKPDQIRELKPEVIPEEKLETPKQQPVETPKWKGEPITVDFKDMDMRDFFLFLADFAHFNIVLDPSVKGSVTVKAHDIPWDQLLDVVCKSNGLGYEVYGSAVDIKKLKL